MPGYNKSEPYGTLLLQPLGKYDFFFPNKDMTNQIKTVYKMVVKVSSKCSTLLYMSSYRRID